MDFRGIAGHVMPVCVLLLGQTRRFGHVLQTTWNLWKVALLHFLSPAVLRVCLVSLRSVDLEKDFWYLFCKGLATLESGEIA